MRARNVKPSLFKNELLATSDPLYAWIFEGLWCLADREGRLEDRPRRIHLEINAGRAYEGTEAALQWLAENGFILRYEAAGLPCILVSNFHKHQNPHQREQPSELPPPPGGADKYRHIAVTEAQRLRIFERDDWKCKACDSDENLHCDHVIPLSKGGTSEDENLQTLCERCNLTKGASQPRHVQGTAKAMASRADSLIPDSPSLIPDSSSLRSEGQRAKPRLSKTVPADFEVSTEDRKALLAELPSDFDLDRETAKFRDHQFRQPHSDWLRAWRGWMRRARDEVRYARVQAANGSMRAAVQPIMR